MSSPFDNMLGEPTKPKIAPGTEGSKPDPNRLKTTEAVVGELGDQSAESNGIHSERATLSARLRQIDAATGQVLETALAAGLIEMGHVYPCKHGLLAIINNGGTPCVMLMEAGKFKR